ncbi:G-protein coupled receptor family C group 5 member C-like [Bombina bombina]|uniref:G-protein coupled receptor family C group 5 member C-like n=1 Tax=Bombina bombina TaxID=8345 RepID=UPI00235A53FE|nr:G-protein coupled receptor family C group 5 member C-like [Bombina bombina]
MAYRNALLILFLANYISKALTHNFTDLAMDLQNFSISPTGCGRDINSIYFGLCDIHAAWGIILEAVAGFGIICTVILAVICLVQAPLVAQDERRHLLPINFMLIVGVFGLFSLVFAFIIAPDDVICIVRRFLFGVLFAMCFSCLVAHSVRLNYLASQNHGPGACLVTLLAAGLFLVEAVINVEWLLITDVRYKFQSLDPSENLCYVTNQDFVAALVYVMFLILSSLVIPFPVLFGQYKQWKRHGKYIIVTACLSVVIWIIWIVMYTYGNENLGHKRAWDDPVLAIALISNGWVFIFCYIIPELVEMRRTGYQYETDHINILNRFVNCPSFIIDNKAFSLENIEEAKDGKAYDKPISPYSGYNGLYPTLYPKPCELTLGNRAKSLSRMTAPGMEESVARNWFPINLSDNPFTGSFGDEPSGKSDSKDARSQHSPKESASFDTCPPDGEASPSISVT